MKKRTLTPEETVKKEERKAAFRTIVKKVAGMTKEEREKLAERMVSITNCEGHRLSIYNTCLIFHQLNGSGTIPTLVGGFRRWIKQGRAVMKGQHGYAILFPREKKNGNGNGAELNAMESDKPELYFLTGYVFDISQTQEIETGA